MTVLVVGASGATGRLLVTELLSRGFRVKAVVRSANALPKAISNHTNLSLIQAPLLDLDDKDLRQLVQGCTAIASCLGHNLTWRGIYGSPRLLVENAVRRLNDAIHADQPKRPVRLVLMNTAGSRNPQTDPPLSQGERCVLGLVRLLLPPHRDNEMAAAYLQNHIGAHDHVVEWVVVRPDTLTHEDEVSAYFVYPTPTRSAIFNAGKTSRRNVAHFMADLIANDGTWGKWKGQMPVIYNRDSC